MEKPVTTSDGHNYDKKSIENWFYTHDISPSTGLVLENKIITPNFELEEKISKFMKENKICTFEEFIEEVKTGNIEKIENLNFLMSHIDTVDLNFHNYTGFFSSFEFLFFCLFFLSL